ncbi:MAG: AAA family ATPase [Chloroflexi bacterium]|nr:AAA family ATPase [Chloroflexota bacterium]
MLTRLKVNGFKNLVDVDVRFGPFTCIAGVNGSGKSNLLDAIRFLSLLAEKPLVEAARAVRGSGNRAMDIRSLFHRVGDQYVDEMSFEAEMIVPAEGVDDLGQPVTTGDTLMRYSLDLGYQGYSRSDPSLPLRINREELVSVDMATATHEPGFAMAPIWRQSAIRSATQSSRTFISYRHGQRTSIIQGTRVTNGATNEAGISVTSALPRTVLSSGAASLEPILALTRQELRSWRVIQMDPSAMRMPDSLESPPILGSDGAHLAAALYRVAHTPPTDGRDPEEAEAAVYTSVANRLYTLLGEILDVEVEHDDTREELTLFVKHRDGTRHPARALSDGTLRFLALAILEAQEQSEVLCIDEIENGIHPERIPALLELLQAIAVDTRFPIEAGNPLRQVIISTHSPSVVLQIPADSLVMAELWPSHDERGRFKRARFRGLANTWRDPEPGRDSLALGALLRYLNPEGYRPLPEPDPERDPDAEQRIMDHPDVRRMLNPTPVL